ncbi:MAG: ATP-binding protein [Cyanobacteria bacterium P01_H01_bin.152]
MHLPSKSQVTLLFGPIGAGKSFIAKQIAQRDGALYLASDKWFQALYLPDMPNPSEMSWVAPRIERCEHLIWTLTEQAIASGIPVVLDVGMATEPSREKFQKLCEHSGCQYQFVFVDAPLEVRSQRVRDRNEQASRTGDLYVSEAIFAFTNAQFQPPTASEITKLSVHVLLNH